MPSSQKFYCIIFLIFFLMEAILAAKVGLKLILCVRIVYERDEISFNYFRSFLDIFKYYDQSQGSLFLIFQCNVTNPFNFQFDKFLLFKIYALKVQTNASCKVIVTHRNSCLALLLSVQNNTSASIFISSIYLSYISLNFRNIFHNKQQVISNFCLMRQNYSSFGCGPPIHGTPTNHQLPTKNILAISQSYQLSNNPHRSLQDPQRNNSSLRPNNATSQHSQDWQREKQSLNESKIAVLGKSQKVKKFRMLSSKKSLSAYKKQVLEKEEKVDENHEMSKGKQFSKSLYQKPRQEGQEKKQKQIIVCKNRVIEPFIEIIAESREGSSILRNKNENINNGRRSEKQKPLKLRVFGRQKKISAWTKSIDCISSVVKLHKIGNQNNTKPNLKQPATLSDIQKSVQRELGYEEPIDIERLKKVQHQIFAEPHHQQETFEQGLDLGLKKIQSKSMFIECERAENKKEENLRTSSFYGELKQSLGAQRKFMLQIQKNNNYNFSNKTPTVILTPNHKVKPYIQVLSSESRQNKIRQGEIFHIHPKDSSKAASTSIFLDQRKQLNPMLQKIQNTDGLSKIAQSQLMAERLSQKLVINAHKSEMKIQQTPIEDSLDIDRQKSHKLSINNQSEAYKIKISNIRQSFQSSLNFSQNPFLQQAPTKNKQTRQESDRNQNRGSQDKKKSVAILQSQQTYQKDEKQENIFQIEDSNDLMKKISQTSKKQLTRKNSKGRKPSVVLNSKKSISAYVDTFHQQSCQNMKDTIHLSSNKSLNAYFQFINEEDTQSLYGRDNTDFIIQKDSELELDKRLEIERPINSGWKNGEGRASIGYAKEKVENMEIKINRDGNFIDMNKDKPNNLAKGQISKKENQQKQQSMVTNIVNEKFRGGQQQMPFCIFSPNSLNEKKKRGQPALEEYQLENSRPSQEKINSPLQVKSNNKSSNCEQDERKEDVGNLCIKQNHQAGQTIIQKKKLLILKSPEKQNQAIVPMQTIQREMPLEGYFTRCQAKDKSDRIAQWRREVEQVVKQIPEKQSKNKKSVASSPDSKKKKISQRHEQLNDGEYNSNKTQILNLESSFKKIISNQSIEYSKEAQSSLTSLKSGKESVNVVLEQVQLYIKRTNECLSQLESDIFQQNDELISIESEIKCREMKDEKESIKGSEAAALLSADCFSQELVNPMKNELRGKLVNEQKEKEETVERRREQKEALNDKGSQRSQGREIKRKGLKIGERKGYPLDSSKQNLQIKKIGYHKFIDNKKIELRGEVQKQTQQKRAKGIFENEFQVTKNKAKKQRQISSEKSVKYQNKMARLSVPILSPSSILPIKKSDQKQIGSKIKQNNGKKHIQRAPQQKLRGQKEERMKDNIGKLEEKSENCDSYKSAECSFELRNRQSKGFPESTKKNQVEKKLSQLKKLTSSMKKILQPNNQFPENKEIRHQSSFNIHDFYI